MKKKLLAFVLALCIIVPYHSVLAGNPASGNTADTGQTIQDTIIFINPLYADTVTPEDLDRTVQEKAVQSDGEPVYHTSVAELGDQMREKLVSREKQITLYYEGSEYNQDVMTDIFHEAVRHTGVPDEGDYLRWQYAGWEGNMSGYVEGNTYFLTLAYTFTYYTTAQQEAEVDTAISDIRNQLELAGKDDYDKLQAIYGYICSHVTYDEEHADDADYKRKYTVYAAIFDHTAVCQGYALLVYRLALEEGIDCRFLAGMGNGVSHGWNIVKLGSYYYNVDATWDAGETQYQYFLRCDENFPEHYREADYSDETFRQTYPMDSMDYAERFHDHSHSYGRPVFIWSSDYQSCTAMFPCSVCEETTPVACTVSSVSGGKKASCTLEDKTYTDFVSGSDIGVEHIFTDVPANAWYREYVQFVYDNGVMSGVSETEFAPKNPLTRAQMVQILYSYEKSPEVDGDMMFTDTQNRSWYYHAVLWAGQNQVVSGFPDNTFRPKDHITRQQLAVILYNYAGRPKVSGSLKTVFADSQQIGGWAADAVLWAYQNGIVRGIKTGNTLRFNPRGNATRAEAATMMKQFIQYLQ